MYAVIQTGGKQYRVSEGDVISVEKLKVEASSKIEFDKVLLIEDGGDVMVGTPYLDAAKVVGSVIENGRGKKVIIFKYKSKKGYRKKQGHRQPYTMVQVDEISVSDKKKATEAVSEKEEAAPAAEPVIEETIQTAEPVIEEVVPVAAPVVEETAPAAEPAVKKTRTKKEATPEDKPAEEKKPAVKRTRAKKEVTEEVAAPEEKPEEVKKPAVKRTRVKKEVPTDGE